MKQVLIDRFWRNVRKTADCWEWTAGLTHYGYGQTWNGKRPITAHRVAWELTHGPIRNGLFLCHHCDNRKCVRPDHLFLGTQADNMRDMRAKNRASKPPMRRGIDQHLSKLTESDVRDIKRRYRAGDSLRTLGKAYSVWYTTISSIVRGRTWSHVE